MSWPDNRKSKVSFRNTKTRATPHIKSREAIDCLVNTCTSSKRVLVNLIMSQIRMLQ